MGPICAACEQELEAGVLSCPDCGLSWDPALHCNRHPDRKADARCCVCQVAVCAECRKRRNFRNLCLDHADVEVIGSNVDVKQVTTTAEAQLVQGLLQSAGIPTWIHNQKDSAYVTNLGSLTPVKILVPRAQLDDARAILADAEHAVFRLDASCPGCGRALADSDESCPDCTAAGHST